MRHSDGPVCQAYFRLTCDPYAEMGFLSSKGRHCVYLPNLKLYVQPDG